MNTKSKYQFWSERVYARDPVTIPLKVQRTSGVTKTWTINEIVAELCREPGSCPHVAQPKPPRTIYGLNPPALRDFEHNLYNQASTFTETYVRRGREHRRAVRRTTPILLVAVASYPGPLGEETPDRRRWENLVLEAVRERWGEKVVSVMAHEDESHYHLHIIVHNRGDSVKKLHFGHAMAMGLIGPTQDLDAGEAYREGGRAAQDWFHNRVGGPMGWERKSPNPRPRTKRSTALALRELALEEQAEALRLQALRLKELEADLIARKQSLFATEPQTATDDPDTGFSHASSMHDQRDESPSAATAVSGDDSKEDNAIARKISAGFRSYRAR